MILPYKVWNVKLELPGLRLQLATEMLSIEDMHLCRTFLGVTFGFCPFALHQRVEGTLEMWYFEVSTFMKGHQGLSGLSQRGSRQLMLLISPSFMGQHDR